MRTSQFFFATLQEAPTAAEVISLDGTKVKANASRHKALSYDHASQLEEQLKAEVANVAIKAEVADQADIPDGMSIPEEIIRREERLKAIVEAKTEIERRAAARHAAEQDVYEKKVAHRIQKEEVRAACWYRHNRRP